MLIRLVLLTIACLSLSFQSSAAEHEDGLWLLMGLDAGYARVNTNIATEFDKNGFQLSVKGLASYEWPKWAVDGSFGWSYQYLTGASAPVASEQITTRALFAEFSPKYRINTRWQLGPLSRSIFGTDLNFGSSLHTVNFGQFAGLQVAYEIPLKKFLLRFTGQALTDLSIGDRQVYIGEAGIQFGFSPFKPSESGSSEESRSVRVELQTGTFYFAFKSAKLSEDAKAHLASIGKFLFEHLGEWERLQIDGHTDRQGPADYNLRLSKDRAEKVKAILIEAGVPSQRLSAEGYGFQKPKVSGWGKEIFKQNRRVELRFSGVSNPSLFKEKVESLK